MNANEKTTQTDEVPPAVREYPNYHQQLHYLKKIEQKVDIPDYRSLLVAAQRTDQEIREGERAVLSRARNLELEDLSKELEKIGGKITELKDELKGLESKLDGFVDSKRNELGKLQAFSSPMVSENQLKDYSSSLNTSNFQWRSEGKSLSSISNFVKEQRNKVRQALYDAFQDKGLSSDPESNLKEYLRMIAAAIHQGGQIGIDRVTAPSVKSVTLLEQMLREANVMQVNVTLEKALSSSAIERIMDFAEKNKVRLVDIAEEARREENDRRDV